MIPLGSTIPLQHPPWATYAVMVACIGLFGYELDQHHNGSGLDAFFARYGWVPAEFTEAIEQHQFPRLSPLLSSMFLHGRWTHLIGNLFFLYVFGRPVEDRLGAGRYVVFFCFGGVVAMLVQTWVAPFSTAPMIGASGAIAALAGAYCVFYPTGRVLTVIPPVFRLVRVPTLGYVLVWLVLLLGSELYLLARSEQLMTWGAHVGGFVAGVVGGPLSLAFKRWRARKKRFRSWRPDSPLIVENSRSVWP